MKTWRRIMGEPDTGLGVLGLVFIAGMAVMYLWLKGDKKMTRLMAKIFSSNGELRVEYTDADKLNPYRVKVKQYIPGTGYKTRTVAKYADFTSCMLRLTEWVKYCEGKTY